MKHIVKLLLLLLLCPTLNAQNFLSERDKQAHMILGYAFATTCNIIIKETKYRNVLGNRANKYERAWFCTLGSFFLGALVEVVKAREGLGFDPQDAFATSIGGAGAGLILISIDF